MPSTTTEKLSRTAQTTVPIRSSRVGERSLGVFVRDRRQRRLRADISCGVATPRFILLAAGSNRLGSLPAAGVQYESCRTHEPLPNDVADRYFSNDLNDGRLSWREETAATVRRGANLNPDPSLGRWFLLTKTHNDLSVARKDSSVTR
jgi:hypothetical protein